MYVLIYLTSFCFCTFFYMFIGICVLVCSFFLCAYVFFVSVSRYVLIFCEYLCLCAFGCVCVSVCVCVYIFLFEYICMLVCLCCYICMPMCVCIFLYMYRSLLLYLCLSSIFFNLCTCSCKWLWSPSFVPKLCAWVYVYVSMFYLCIVASLPAFFWIWMWKLILKLF